MANFFTDNPDLVFQFDHLGLEEVVALTEHDYEQAGQEDGAPTDYQDAMDNYRRVLEVAGGIAGDFIAPRAEAVDAEGATFEAGTVSYARGMVESLERLSQADLMGVTLPRKYGGLGFPTTIYIMTIEMISQADASLMNLYGLQDIAETIHRFGSEAQCEEFLPGFCSGQHTGAMALTEPDAGSDLQAVRLRAHQDDSGQWVLNGVKRFITNGCGDVLLVLARSEPGTKDGRGLSLFVCRGGDQVKVRRIENKLGIHGSPTCELQFNDTPAQLVGRRKFGLIKYVMDLMNGARLGVSAQGLGIAQAAYEEAYRYAKARKQFGKAIIDIPAVTNMLIDMRVELEANRTLLYATAKQVDLRDKLTGRVAELKAQGKPFSEESTRAKKLSKIAALLTPLTKGMLTESANRIAYDAIQIHGGAGYMKEFSVGRLARDARITTIYEGTTQLQVVAAAGGVMKDLLGGHFEAREKESYDGDLAPLAARLVDLRKLYLAALAYVQDKGDRAFEEVAAKELVQMVGQLYVGYLLLDQARLDERRVLVAQRYIIGALAMGHKSHDAIVNDQFADLSEADRILS
jgi:alkylation response protein AidB-like acyl-CoA dehydrogenase